MTRRRNTINIYDYPEHLNPFREDDDDNCDKYNTTGRRRPSFRVNAWTMFSPSKGNTSKTSEDITPQPSAASRFMTWTPKLLRRSFRRSSPSRSSSPWDNSSHSSSRLSFRTPSSRSSLPPPGSSRTSLPPPSSSPTHRTTPPSRPAPPNLRSPLSPTNKENGPNNVEINPVPPRRRALYTATTPGKTAGEKPPEDEVKYIQQGAKPKKKRRAPLPPQPSPSKSVGDSQPVNSNELEVSVTPPASSNTVEEPTSHHETVSARTDLDVNTQESDIVPQKEILEPSAKDETPENGETCKSANPAPEEHVQTGVTEIQDEGKLEESPASPDKPTEVNANGSTEHRESPELEQLPKSQDNDGESQESCNQKDTDTVVQSISKTETTGNATTGVHLNGINGHHNSNEHLKVDFDVVLHISEEDLRDKEDFSDNRSQKNLCNTSNNNNNMESGLNNLDNEQQEDKLDLHNGKKTSDDSEVLQNETQLNDINAKENPLKVPAPKPRTILPMKD